ncbi:MAG TPA: urea carboxylase [Steroidobacteraceae bacterium]|nr:urea carboxylase [Steroidobacteraceae bacterium]
MFDKVLIANRGAIACRIIRTLRRMGVRSVAVYSDVDRYSLHVTHADESFALGGSTATDSYLRQDRLIEAARATGAQAIHPGYGFLSENAAFAEKCAQNGIAFIGPTPGQMRDFGLKHRARELAEAHGLPLLRGSGLLADLAQAKVEAQRIGFPVMLKSTAGGGGIGMQLCRDVAELEGAFAAVERLAKNNFSDGGLFIEKYIERARHIEVQLFGDGSGTVIALGERDCSTQRRNQKVIEETPAPGLTETTRARLMEAAVKLGRAVGYRSAGTVEFVYDVQASEFYFLEVNTRLQVEHGVTEEVTGIDLVEWMIQVAAGEPPDLAAYRHNPRGHSIQVRLYAEDPARNFRPSSGLLSHVTLPTDVRVDTWIEPGTEVSSFYDPLLAKIISHAPTREQAVSKLERALANTSVYGIETNLDYLRGVLAHETFRSGQQYTRFLSTFEMPVRSVEVLKPGTHSTVQEYPGRLGYWNVGVPPSGPMDAFAFRLANRIVGNREWHAALELTGTGPTLKFGVATRIALCGAQMTATLDGQPVPYWEPVQVPAGSVLALGSIQGAGQRTYLAVKGGFVVPSYLGSKATFTLGQFGGHVGRALRTGDVLRLSAPDVMVRFLQSDEAPDDAAPAPASLIPKYRKHWNIAVTPGPHAAPDFFTDDDIRAFFAAEWEVHYNSSRTGVRLIGPKPTWARTDGGEAGLHPSNVHDNAYAVGAVDYTGDMPVILGPDGPSLGGFVCPAIVTRADLWKLGQLRPGDRIRFHGISCEVAMMRREIQDESIAGLEAPHGVPTGVGDAAVDDVEPVTHPATAAPARSSVLCVTGAGNDAVCYRQSGEDYILVEFGPPVLELELRFRVHALMQALERRRVLAIIDLTPGIRSLQVHFDSRASSQSKMLDLLMETHASLPALEDLEVPSRIVHLPLSWDDPATRLAIEKYMQSVRADAPWCPSNIEFIRRINGLDSIEDVKRIVFEARYLVMGLGDVYLGAPVATPLDPRHRLVTTKYNPARTWTPENAVGIGGAYLCVYGMEGPGGYQFVGRTVQMWNRYRQSVDFREGRQWLLRFFDQIRFYPVSADELLRMRDDFPHGRFQLRIESSTLKLGEQRRFLAEHERSIAEFKSRQQAAFEAERERWRQSGVNGTEPDVPATTAPVAEPADIPQGCVAVESPVTGSVWHVNVEAGARVAAGETLVVVEAMKMEVPIATETAAEVIEVRTARGRAVSAGDTVIVLRPL